MDKKITYDVVSEFAGHQHNQDVELISASQDIYKHCKEDAMQLSVNGVFKQFNDVEQLQTILSDAMEADFSVRVFDELIGG